MILNPTPFLGFGGAYKGAVNHVAMGRVFVSSGSPVITDIGFRVSADAQRFFKDGPRGDLAAAFTSGAGKPGAFYPAGVRKLGSALYAFGQLWDDSNNSRCALFRSTDGGRTWVHKATSIDGTPGSSGARLFVDIAANDSYVVALSSTGERAVSTDGGETFTGYGNIGFTGSTNCIAASSAGFVAGGNGGQLFTATDPRGAWTARTSQFGTSAINAAVAGNVFLLVGAGGNAATAPLNNLATWTARTTGIASSINGAAYKVSRWFIWGGGAMWRTSTDATSGFTAPANKPGGDDLSLVRDAYHDGSQWVVHFNSGALALSDDDATWQTIADNGLAEQPYFGAAT